MLMRSGRLVARGTNPYRRKTMVLVRYEPWSAVERLHRQIGQIFGGNVDAPAADDEAAASNGAAAVNWVPSVGVFEQRDHGRERRVDRHRRAQARAAGRPEGRFPPGAR